MQVSVVRADCEAIRIVPEWNVKVEEIVQYGGVGDIRIVPEWNVKGRNKEWTDKKYRLESYQSGM